MENIKTKPVTRKGKFKTITGPVNTTGKTAASVQLVLVENQITITAAKHTFTAEYGRRPGPVGKAGHEALAQWMAAKGIEPGAIWAIKKSIEKKGTLMHQQIKKSGIIDVFSEGPLSVAEFTRTLSVAVETELTSNMVRQWQQ